MTIITSQPLISIITINKNNAIGLQQTIKSVICQTYDNYEYIVVDGESEDESVKIIKSFKDNISLWISENDSGIYNAMNKGWLLSKGKYCLFLNSGDCLFHPNSLTIASRKLKDQDLCAFSLIIRSNLKYLIQVPPTNPSLFTMTQGSLPHPTTFIKRNLLIKMNGFNENFKVISDWLFFLLVLIKNNCSYESVNIPLSIFEGEGISSINIKADELLRKKILQQEFPRIAPDYFLDAKIFHHYNFRVFEIIHKKTYFKPIWRFLLAILSRLLGVNQDDEKASLVSKFDYEKNYRQLS